jgi:hypothetical protein
MDISFIMTLKQRASERETYRKDPQRRGGTSESALAGGAVRRNEVRNQELRRTKPPPPC